MRDLVQSESTQNMPPTAASTSSSTAASARSRRTRGSTAWLWGLALCACTASHSEAYLRGVVVVPLRTPPAPPPPPARSGSTHESSSSSSSYRDRIIRSRWQWPSKQPFLRATVEDQDTIVGAETEAETGTETERVSRTQPHSSDDKPNNTESSSSSSDAITRPLENGGASKKSSIGSKTDPPLLSSINPNGEASDSDSDLDSDLDCILRQQLDEKSGESSSSEPANTNTPAPTTTTTTTTRSMWQRRNARSAEEGIRRENTIQLSSLLAKARSIETRGRQYAARTISGLINALAEEVNDLDVEVDARNDTPFSGKHVDAIRIKFSRLGFKPLQMGGLSQAVRDADQEFTEDITKDLTDLSCADEAFDRIDADRSGALDIDEIALALSMAAGANDEMDERKSNVLKDLASSLVLLYDFNGDGVVDRNEYKSMVEDMAALRKSQKKSPKDNEENIPEIQDKKEGDTGWLSSAKQWVQGIFSQVTDRQKEGDMKTDQWKVQQDDLVVDVVDDGLEVTTSEGIVDVSDSVQVIDTMSKSLGSITLSDLKIDLRRLLFGAVPILKHITPGGPLILEPFTATVNGSFSRDDIMNSFLLDAGLRRLVARALRRRVRSFRDIIDGAVFFGRSWNMASAHAPVVEVPEVTNIEFDDDNRLIITGIARVQTRSDAPQIENAFKVRTRIGTRKEGRTIKLIEPELAFVIECPKSVEHNIRIVCDLLGLERPAKPEPIFSFFPIYSPFKVDDDDGFDLGEDNRISSIFVQDGALRFELSAVLRPGRFLGNHYLAFTIPNRTFIITMDRVKEGIRSARKLKQAARALKQSADAKSKRHRKVEMPPIKVLPEHPVDTAHKNGKAQPPSAKRVAPKSFFSRFVDGYLQAEREEESERFTRAISDWFGRQGGDNTESDEDE